MSDKVDVAVATVNNLASDVANVQDLVNLHSTAISENTSAIAANTNDIAENSNDIAAINSKLDDLDFGNLDDEE